MDDRNAEYEKARKFGADVYELARRSGVSPPDMVYALLEVIASAIVAAPSKEAKEALLLKAAETLPKMVKGSEGRKRSMDAGASQAFNEAMQHYLDLGYIGTFEKEGKQYIYATERGKEAGFGQS